METCLLYTSAIIHVKESVKYTVVYDWGSDYPTDVTVPKDDTKYENIEKAKEAVKNQKYDENSTSTAEKLSLIHISTTPPQFVFTI